MSFGLQNYNTYYVSTTGSDSNAGTSGSPFETLQKAIDLARPGDTILLEPGTYSSSDNTGYAAKISGKSGTVDAPITIKGNGGLAVLDNSADATSWGMYTLDIKNAQYWNIENIGVTGAVQNSIGAWAVGANVLDSSNIIFKDCDFFNNQGPGLVITGKSGNNSVINSTAHDNYDLRASVAGGNADGFDICFIATGFSGNLISGSKAWNNSDDGFDLYNADSPVTIVNSEAWHNGYIPGTDLPSMGDGDGFKLGMSNVAVVHRIENSIAYDNKLYGFDSNGAKGAIEIVGNTAYSNNGGNYYFDDRVKFSLTNNTSYGGGTPDVLGNASIGSGNLWNGLIQDMPADVVDPPIGNSLPPADTDDQPSTASHNEIHGTDLSDLLKGDTGDNWIFGYDGDDTLKGGSGCDLLDGGNGRDRLLGGSGNDLVQGGSDDDYLNGGIGDDTLVGGSGYDRLVGGGGADRLDGGNGRDKLSGGDGADVFVFSSASETKAGNYRDQIRDFDRKEGDKIDLVSIDGNSAKTGNQSLIYIGGDTFDGHAGQLRFDSKVGILSGDTNGDRIADFEIYVSTSDSIVGGDLIL